MSAAVGRETSLKVLVVDAEPSVRRAVAKVVIDGGMTAFTSESASAALALLVATPMDAVVIETSRLTELLELGGERGGAELVVMAALGDEAGARLAVEIGAAGLVGRPLVSREGAALTIRAAASLRQLRARADRAARALVSDTEHEALSGLAGPIKTLRREAQRLARTSAPLFIVGEPGTGRGALARAIHAWSPRAERGFTALDCDLPEHAVERELFAEGGLLARSAGGTLHLRSVEALGVPAQRRLLETIDQNDIRVIASSSEEPHALRQRGAITDELCRRLGLFVLRTVPLRARKVDIVTLSYAAIGRWSERTSRPAPRLSSEALRALRAEAWPGNLPELEAALSHAAEVAQDRVVRPADLHFVAERAMNHERASSFDPSLIERPYVEAKHIVVDAFNEFYCSALLLRAGQNSTQAAALAGMDRSNFRRLLKKPRG